MVDAAADPSGRTDLKICILLRASPDWANMSKEQFDDQAREFCRSVGRPLDQISRAAKLWDDTFSVTYQEVRAAVKEIAQSALHRWTTKPTVIIGPPDIAKADTLYLFADDDDWYFPELPDHLANAISDRTDAVVFGNVVLHRGILRPFELHCHSNNYGVMSHRIEDGRTRWSDVLHHGSYANQALSSLDVVNIPFHLSVKNTHPASTVFMEQGLKDEFSSRRLRTLVEQYVGILQASPIRDSIALISVREQCEAVLNLYRRLLA